MDPVSHVDPHVGADPPGPQRNGARLVVVDPYRSRTAAYADVHLRPHAGTDGALALAVGHVDLPRRTSPTTSSSRDTHVGRRRVPRRRRAVDAGAGGGRDRRRRPATIGELRPRDTPPRGRSAIRIGVGMQRAAGAGSALRAIQCLTALTGQWRWPAGGISQHGVDRRLRPRRPHPPRPRHRRAPATVNMIQLGRVLTDPTLDPPIRALFVWNSNPAVIAADQQRVLAGLRRDDLFTVVHDQFLTDTARHADVVLPATTMLEHADLVGSWGFSYVSWNEAGDRPRR